MPPPEPRKEGKPLLRLRSRFAPLTVLARHPIRLVLIVLLPAAGLPEMQQMTKWLFGFGGFPAALFVVLILAFFILLPPLLMATLDARSVRYDFHHDHLVFTENFLLREKIRIPYKSVRNAGLRRSLAQKISGVSDIVLETAAGAQAVIVIPDVRLAPQALQRIKKLLEQYQAGASSPR